MGNERQPDTKETTMDCRVLLKKYIAHVTEVQGVDLITLGRTKSSVSMTDAEREELYRISEEAEVEAVQARTGPTVASKAPPIDIPSDPPLPPITWSGWRAAAKRDGE